MQLINGIALITSFGGSRLVWGTYQSIHMYQDIWTALKTPGETALPVPAWLAMSYLGANTLLSILNFYWFGRMIETVTVRFRKPEGKELGKDKRENGKKQR